MQQAHGVLQDKLRVLLAELRQVPQHDHVPVEAVLGALLEVAGVVEIRGPGRHVLVALGAVMIPGG